MTTRIEMTHTMQSTRNSVSNLLWVSPLAMAAATVANVVLYIAAGSIFPEVTRWSGAGMGQIIGATIAYLLIGTIVFALIARFSSHPARHFFTVATVGMVFSLGMPISAAFGYGAPGVPPASIVTAITLSLMHIVSYGIVALMFNRLVLNDKQSIR